MAKQCDHCGKILPSDTNRYCPGCGKIVASSRPAKKSLSDDPPVWMKQLETSFTNKRSNLPLRELNVKVWDEEETRDLTLLESGVDSGGDEEDVVDSLPTSPLMLANSPIISTPSQLHSNLPGVDVDEVDDAEELPTKPHMISLPQNISVSRVSSLPGIDSRNELLTHDQIEDIATRPYATQPRNNSHEIEKPVLYQQGQAMQKPTGFMPVPPVARSKKNNRKRLAIVFGLLFFLLSGGVIAWVIVAQPFAVPAITKTTQNFNNTSPGVSLQYPQNWAVDVNKQNGTVSFYDDNHTDQVNITVVVAVNQNINLYMNKTVSSLGMTGQRTQTEVSFAGAAWQQIQGSVQESGANYTATLLVTMHGQYYYTILQLAPSSTYPLEEQLVFSKMRSSFQF